MLIRILSFIALLLLPVVGSVHANLLYSYVGRPFEQVTGAYTTADYLRGWFVLNDSFIPPNFDGGADHYDFTGGVRDFAFTDGHQVLTPATTSATSFQLGVPSYPIFSHAIPGETVSTSFFVFLLALDGVSYIETALVNREAGDFAGLQGVGSGTCWPNPAAFGCSNFSDPSQPNGIRYWGTWTVTPIPEPMSLLLVVAGIVGVGVARRFYRSSDA